MERINTHSLTASFDGASSYHSSLRNGLAVKLVRKDYFTILETEVAMEVLMELSHFIQVHK